MPIYEFACDDCFKRGVVSTWEMQFKMDDAKNSFCPACGSKGKQVILTAPMIAGGDRHDRFKRADEMLTRALDEQGVTRVDQRHLADHVEKRQEMLERAANGDLEPPRQSQPDPFKPRWGNPHEILGQAASATALAHAEGPATGNDVRQKLSKVLPSEAIVHPADAKKGRIPQHGVKID